jgi:hypothetical protein
MGPNFKNGKTPQQMLKYKMNQMKKLNYNNRYSINMLVL